MLLNKSFRDPDLPGDHTEILRQFDFRFQPEFRLTALTINMNLHSCFLAGKEIEADPPALKIVGPNSVFSYVINAYGLSLTRHGSKVAEL
jgi:hypothetical protein